MHNHHDPDNGNSDNNKGMSELNWWSACQQLEQHKRAYAMATVVAHVGSVPRAEGAKMVITPTEQFDSVGGGTLEYQVIQAARDGLRHGVHPVEIKRFNLNSDLGQCCGGAIQIMLEYFHTRTPEVMIFGAGHVTRSLMKIFSELPCHTTIIDSRPEWLKQLRDPGCDTRLCSNPAEMVGSLPDDAYLIIMTHDHALDYELTKTALEEKRFAYIGLIGSAGKRHKFELQLRKQLSDPDLLNQLICPIGHPEIQGKQPMQVAVSIAAQLIGLFNNKQSAEEEGKTQWQQISEARNTLENLT